MRVLPSLLILVATLAAVPALATDVDGPTDCTDLRTDWGDAPEGVQAYPGVLGAFPTCLASGPTGTPDWPFCPSLSTPPGPAGFVRHVPVPGEDAYWLGCGPLGGGIDSDLDGKVNDNGGGTSACDPNVGTDCVENFFGLAFGQDECYGSDDAGIAAPVAFTACAVTNVDFEVYSCASIDRTAYVNVLVDWNQDGDWSDHFDCAGVCTHEWAAKNVLVSLAPGCNTITIPVMAGPNAGDGWMRVTISNDPVPDDFPWAGSATIAGQSLNNGETEDYPVRIGGQMGGGGCTGFEDFGDAPEGAQAYTSGVLGAFPTCIAFTPAGTQTFVCPPISTAPGPTGLVHHVAMPPDPVFWLGCGDPALGTNGVDSEVDGKTNDTGAPSSVCDPAVAVDCNDGTFPALTFGQDECLGAPDRDAGLLVQPSFTACSFDSIEIQTYNCDAFEFMPAYLNVLIDMNEDGDWNDNFDCAGSCAYEWAVKNAPVFLPPGCATITSPAFLIGPNGGESWMRVTLSIDPLGDDFPWDGSAMAGFIRGGETEDYPVTITGPDTCRIAYDDFGDAPEGNTAYATGVAGFFPTCQAPGLVAAQDIECETPLSTPPGAAGYVHHVALATDPVHFWLGCATAGLSPLDAIDGERDGKTNTGAPLGGPSVCNPGVGTDCLEMGLIGIGINQDECVGDLDAGMRMPTFFRACSTAAFAYEAFNCASQPVEVILNVLVDFNHDGDWNDNLLARCGQDTCANEWAVKNERVMLSPGCNFLTTPQFSTGPDEGRSWLRISLTQDPVPDDYPWNGSAGTALGFFERGETEDHPVNIVPPSTDVEAPLATGGLWFGAPRPNPARDAVTFRFAIPAAAEVSLAIYDLFGRRVADLARGTLSAGAHTETWDFRDGAGVTVPPGVYLAKLGAGGEVLTRAVVRVR